MIIAKIKRKLLAPPLYLHFSFFINIMLKFFCLFVFTPEYREMNVTLWMRLQVY